MDRVCQASAPASAKTGNFYGGQWLLMPNDRTEVPRQGFDQWDLTRERLKAIEQGSHQQ